MRTISPAQADAVARKADHYFAEQCRRLGPIGREPSRTAPKPRPVRARPAPPSKPLAMLDRFRL